MKIIFATGNLGKLSEVKRIFEDYDVEIISLKELENVPEIDENELTFSGNSFKKSREIFEEFGIPTIADDSGLAVEQLNGKPGVFSARFAGENCTYEDNNNKLLNELSFFSQPHFAKFVCSATYFSAENQFEFSGELLGEIIDEFRGNNGFGYDPIFVPENYSNTLSELGIEVKNKISHRAKAFYGLIDILTKKGIIHKKIT
jgi:XTP/dITP diphosphohydrolase